jgi:hypothetical protein
VQVEVVDLASSLGHTIAADGVTLLDLVAAYRDYGPSGYIAALVTGACLKLTTQLVLVDPLIIEDIIELVETPNYKIPLAIAVGAVAVAAARLVWH